MKTIKIFSIAALLTVFAACEEFQPVFTGKYQDPEYMEPVDMSGEDLTTIAELKDMYTGTPVTIGKEVANEKVVIIAGQVTTSDKAGNLYKSLYIQDATAGIELKIGKNGLYNEFKLGQWVYVYCNGLTVGDYNGMIQLGYSDPTGEYETSYMEHQYIIDNHIYKGDSNVDPVESKLLTSEAELKKKENLGRLVTIRDLTYMNRTFVLIYVNPNLSGESKKAPTNRIFCDEEASHNWGINTWAMSESLFKKNLEAGNFDSAELQDGSKTVSEFKNADGTYSIIPTAYSVSQYFKMGNTPVQVRSSGYARFSDQEIDPEVRSGAKKIDFTGILTEYNGEAQFTLIDLESGIYIHD